MSRTPIPLATRFKILKRDSFKCQYCGKNASQIELEVDHMKPVAKGGTDDTWNLITACELCNKGKAARRLYRDRNDFSRNSSIDCVTLLLDYLEDHLGLNNWMLTDTTHSYISHALLRHGFTVVMEALRLLTIEIIAEQLASRQRLQRFPNSWLLRLCDSVIDNEICYDSSHEWTNRSFYYDFRAVLRDRLRLSHEQQLECRLLIRRAFRDNDPVSTNLERTYEHVESLVNGSPSWEFFAREMETLIDANKDVADATSALTTRGFTPIEDLAAEMGWQ